MRGGREEGRKEGRKADRQAGASNADTRAGHEGKSKAPQQSKAQRSKAQGKVPWSIISQGWRTRRTASLLLLMQGSGQGRAGQGMDWTGGMPCLTAELNRIVQTDYHHHHHHHRHHHTSLAGRQQGELEGKGREQPLLQSPSRSPRASQSLTAFSRSQTAALTPN